jgi:hypothetical protein
MTKSFIHPGERRPVNKATMDAPQEEFLEPEAQPSCNSAPVDDHQESSPVRRTVEGASENRESEAQ